MTVNVDTYWRWEGRPAVIVDYGKHFGGLLRREGADSWTRVTERDVVDWFKEGQEMTRDEFEESFGKIGVSLPHIESGASGLPVLDE